MTQKRQYAEGKRGIILDVDGTLWDALVPATDAWNLYGKTQPDVTGTIPYEKMAGCLGKTMYEIADIIYGYLPGERKMEVLRGAMDSEIRHLWNHPGTIYPGVKETLIRLREMGWHLYIVSNCPKGYIECMMHAADVEDLIEDHICFEDTLQGKDANIRLCCERNQLDRALYVGDTQGDLDAVRAAGLDFVFAAYGFGTVDGGADVIGRIGSFPELAEIV